MTESPKEIITHFVGEKLSGKIAKLEDYCFSELNGTRYGRCSGMSEFDCDNTVLANAIYVLLWGGRGNIFPELTMENVGRGKAFRGDTMNSFNTVFGKYDSTIDLWEKYGMGEQVDSFQKKYHTIGNFIVLPNRATPGIDTLNMYRGRTWGDFFDRFLIELDKVLSGKEDKDAGLSACVACNQSSFQGIQISKMSNSMFLQDYIDESNAMPKPVFGHYFAGNKIKRDIHDAAYRKFALSYIEKTIEIISNRSKKICLELSRKMELPV